MPDLDDAIVIGRPIDGVVVLKLNRPERRNVLSTPVVRMLADTLQRAEGDDGVRVTVLTGSEKVFAASAYLQELRRPAANVTIESPHFRAWVDIRSFHKPLLAAVDDWCLGAGAELMMCADIVVAGSDTKICQPETNLGLMPGAGGTSVLPRLVRPALAMEMVLLGEAIAAEKALGAGLITEVCKAGQALDWSLEIAKTLNASAPLALKMAKASIRQAETLSLEEHLLSEREFFASLLNTSDSQEGIDAFLEKREPKWQGN